VTINEKSLLSNAVLFILIFLVKIFGVFVFFFALGTRVKIVLTLNLKK